MTSRTDDARRSVASVPDPTFATPFEPDERQQAVLDHDRGALRVIGGPGTGKTRLLVEAAAARVQAGVPAGELLVLTFSPVAAADLRSRLTRRLGQVSAEPLARTVHSYAFGLLREAALADERPTPRLLPSAERDLMLREILAGRTEERRDRWPEELAAARTTRAFVEELQDVLMRASERGVTPRELRNHGRRQRRPEWIEAASVYEEYLDVAALQSPGAFDAPELVQRAIAALQDDPRRLQAERLRRRRLFVDEFSDLDQAQVRLLALIGSAADEVIVTGDPDQSVFGFRGSDPVSLSDTDAALGLAADTVVLNTGYRCPPQLITAGRRVVERLPGPAEHRQLSASPITDPSSADGPPPAGFGLRVAVFGSPAAEASQVARFLRRRHLEDAVAWRDMAVVLRSTAAIGTDVLRRQLALAGVPVGRIGRRPLAGEPVVGLFGLLLRRLVAVERCTDADVESLLLSPIGHADPLQVQALRRRLRTAGFAEGSLAALFDEAGFIALAGEQLQPSVQAVRRVLAAGRAAAVGGSAQEVLWALWDEAGLARRLQQRSLAGGPDGARADRDLDAALDLFAEAAALSKRSAGTTLDGLLGWLDQLQIADGGDVASRTADVVEVLSAHAAKGRQWQVVCVAGVQEGSWPSIRQRGTLLGSEDLVDLIEGRAFGTTNRGRQRLAEERRLFYVAVSRAQQSLLVTAVSDEDSAPSRFLDELDPPTDPLAASRPVSVPERPFDLTGLVAELRAHVIDPTASAGDRSEAADELGRLSAAGVTGADPDGWWGLLEQSTPEPVRSPTAALRISPSHLQGYLDCQLRALLEDLSATDGREVIEASVGTLVHQIAEDASDEAALAELEARAAHAWPSLEFVAAWQARTERARASRMLAKLAQWLGERRGRLELVGKEQPFTIEVNGVTLSGRIDRVERTADGRLLVVDLKATKRNFSASDVESHAQLAVYQLAVAESGELSAGAALVHLGKAGQKSPELVQRPLAEQDEPDRIPAELARLAGELRKPQILATLNSGCDFCPVHSCCPLQDDGRYVSGRGGCS